MPSHPTTMICLETELTTHNGSDTPSDLAKSDLKKTCVSNYKHRQVHIGKNKNEVALCIADIREPNNEFQLNFIIYRVCDIGASKIIFSV